MKFLIRDVLWLTLFVATALAWWLDHRAASAKYAASAEHVEVLKNKLSDARDRIEMCEAVKFGPGFQGSFPYIQIDWED